MAGNQELLPLAAIRATELDAEAEGAVRSVATLNAAHPTNTAIYSGNSAFSDIRLKLLVIALVIFVLLAWSAGVRFPVRTLA